MNTKKRSFFYFPAEFKSFFNPFKAHSINATGRTALLKKLPIRWWWNSKELGTFSYNPIKKKPVIKNVAPKNKKRVSNFEAKKRNKLIEFFMNLINWLFGKQIKTATL